MEQRILSGPRQAFPMVMPATAGFLRLLCFFAIPWNSVPMTSLTFVRCPAGAVQVSSHTCYRWLLREGCPPQDCVCRIMWRPQPNAWFMPPAAPQWWRLRCWLDCRRVGTFTPTLSGDAVLYLVDITTEIRGMIVVQ